MKQFFWILAVLLPLSAFAAQPRSIVMTIQENGKAQISETHSIPPADATGLIRIGPLPETLLPSSVNAVPVERGETLEILSQRFAYDLLDNASLFRAYRGETVQCEKGGAILAGRLATLPDFSSLTPSLILSTEGQTVQVVPDLLNLDSITFPALPDLARTPTLFWKPAAGQTPPAAVQLHYAASGLAWSASHEAILSDNARSIALSTRVHLQNQTTRDFAHARIRLALTDKGQFAPLVPAPNDPRANRTPTLRYSADGKSWIPERTAASASIVATYDLPQPLSLPADSDTYTHLLEIPALAVETRYIYDGVRFDRYQRNRRADWNLGTESASIVETDLTFRNNQAVTLPPGEFRLLQGEADRALQWIGTDWLPSVPPGGTTTLRLGPATGLSGTRIRTSYSEIDPRRVSEESFEITLKNQSDADQTFTVIEHLYRGENHEIIAANAEHRPGDDPHSIQFLVPVKAGTENSITYTVRYTW